MAKILSVKNFEKYQHYKNRLPPWIKLHLEILDDPSFLRLPDASKWHYVGLLLLASRHENAIPCDELYIKGRIGLTEKLDLTPRFIKDHLLASGKQSASTAQALCPQMLTQSRDRVETETEESGACDAPASASVVRITKGKRAIRDDDGMTDKHRAFALTLKLDPGPEWGKFKNYCLANDRRYANFEAAFRNWLARAAELRGERRVL